MIFNHKIFQDNEKNILLVDNRVSHDNDRKINNSSIVIVIAPIVPYHLSHKNPHDNQYLSQICIITFLK